MATITLKDCGITKQTAEYRGFEITLFRYGRSNDWDGLAKGHGTCLYAGLCHGVEETLAELRARIDRAFDLGTVAEFTREEDEKLFRSMCVKRHNRWSGQFHDSTDARKAKAWALRNFPGAKARVRTLRNFLPTLGHMVYELTVTTPE